MVAFRISLPVKLDNEKTMQSLWSTVLTALIFSTGVVGSHFVHERSEIDISNTIQRKRIDHDRTLPVRIGLQQDFDALNNAESWLMSVSDPDSPQYGRHWTSSEVIDAFQPSLQTLQVVSDWLISHNITDFTHSDNRLWFAFELSAAKTEALLHAEYFEYELASGHVNVCCDSYSLPEHVAPFIDYITPGVKGAIVVDHRSGKALDRRHSGPAQRHRRTQFVNNSVEHNFVNATHGVHECWRLVTPACIRALYNFSVPDSATKVSPNNSLGIFAGGDDYYQGDLDKFFAAFTQIPIGTEPKLDLINGARDPANNSHSPSVEAEEGDFDIEVALPIVYPQNVTIFDAAPYSLKGFDALLDAIDGSYCKKSNASNRLECGVFKPPNVLSSSLAGPETDFPNAWKARQCTEYLKLGLQGVSVFYISQDWGVGALDLLSKNGENFHHCYDQVGPTTFLPAFPASCPWVTSVGATQIRLGRTVHDPETAANWWDGSMYEKASGGGFSNFFHSPAYQNPALSTYYSDFNPPWPYYFNGNYHNSTGRYSRNGRGIPDISAVGNKIASVVSGNFLHLTGTSASAPIVAALFNRVVEERLRAGKGPLGFVNPTLYKNPQVLNDIVAGSNGFCSPDGGFAAVPGWDPVTGLGTPNYAKLLELFVNLP